jgi:hypothetical protein
MWSNRARGRFQALPANFRLVLASNTCCSIVLLLSVFEHFHSVCPSVRLSVLLLISTSVYMFFLSIWSILSIWQSSLSHPSTGNLTFWLSVRPIVSLSVRLSVRSSFGLRVTTLCLLLLNKTTISIKWIFKQFRVDFPDSISSLLSQDPNSDDPASRPLLPGQPKQSANSKYQCFNTFFSLSLTLGQKKLETFAFVWCVLGHNFIVSQPKATLLAFACI